MALAPDSPFVDAIGDRLHCPERVPPQYRHLIPDDQQRVKRICEVCPCPRKGRWALDVGSSDGGVLQEVRRAYPDGRFIGSDVPGVSTRLAASLVWDIREPPPRFDTPPSTILCTEVLEHLTGVEARQALQHLYQALAPDGTLLVTVPNREPADLYEISCRSRWQWPDHRSGWTIRRLHLALTVAGWRTMHFHALYPPEPPRLAIWLIATAQK